MSRIATSKIVIGAALIAAGIGAALFARHGLTMTASGQTIAKAPPALPVETVTVEKRPVRVWRSFPARLDAVDQVDLRPQVSGRIVEVHFQDGQTVAKGDVLFVIEPQTFEAAVTQARADLAAAQERRSFSERELMRARKLIRTHAIAESTLDQRANDFASAKSAVETADARLVQAEVDLDHAYVKAPIAGRVSRVEVTVGNIVQAGANAPLLTTIVSKDGIYADFEVDENTYLRYVRSVARDTKSEQTIPVRLFPGSEGNEAIDGRIHSFDNQIDPKTGTIRARAYFANTDGRLLPGMFARVKMGSATKQDAVLLTERAILTDQDRKFVYVVRPDKKAAYREVALGASIGGERIISKGLKSGDQVIVSGLMLVRPNVLVAPKQAQASNGGQARVAADQ